MGIHAYIDIVVVVVVVVVVIAPEGSIYSLHFAHSLYMIRIKEKRDE